MDNLEIKEGKTAAIVAYMTIVGSLIAITMNLEPKNAFARFHIRQAFGLHLVFIGCALFLSVSFYEYVWVALYIFYFVSWFFGFLGALNNKVQPMPLLGTFFQKWFTFIQ